MMTCQTDKVVSRVLECPLAQKIINGIYNRKYERDGELEGDLRDLFSVLRDKLAATVDGRQMFG